MEQEDAAPTPGAETDDWRRELVVRVLVVVAVLGIQAAVVWAIEDPTRVQILRRRLGAKLEGVLGPVRRERQVRRNIGKVIFYATEAVEGRD